MKSNQLATTATSECPRCAWRVLFERAHRDDPEQQQWGQLFSSRNYPSVAELISGRCPRHLEAVMEICGQLFCLPDPWLSIAKETQRMRAAVYK